MESYGKIDTAYQRSAEDFKITRTVTLGIPSTFKDTRWIWTEKVDGTNVRVTVTQDEVRFQGRTDNANFSARNIAALGAMFEPKIPAIRKAFPSGVTFYGELFGPKIQKGGGNYGEEQSFVGFDLYRHPMRADGREIPGIFYSFDAMAAVMLTLEIPTVPVISYGSIADARDYLERGSLRSAWGDFQPEGLVLRLPIEITDSSGRRGMTKLKFKDLPTNK